MERWGAQGAHLLEPQKAHPTSEVFIVAKNGSESKCWVLKNLMSLKVFPCYAILDTR